MKAIRRLLTRGQNADSSRPGQPRDATKGLDTAQEESDDGGDGDKDGGAGTMARQGIEGSCDTQDTRAGDKDAEQSEGDAENLVTGATEQFSAYVIETVDIGMAQLEVTDDPARPGSADGNSNEADDARGKTQGVEDGWDG